MKLTKKIKNKIHHLYKLHVKKEKFLVEVHRWFKDKGDMTLRLDYPLTPSSVVFDLGGYHGDFAADIHEKYGCTVYIFEPVSEFFQICVDRFKGNGKIHCFKYGLSATDTWMDIGLAENASSFQSPHTSGKMERVEIRSIIPCIRELGVDSIDLMKINIEGGEFEVLDAMIDSNYTDNITNLQIQFHNFVENAEEKRNALRKKLNSTHIETWNYEFVWENWKIKDTQSQ